MTAFAKVSFAAIVGLLVVATIAPAEAQQRRRQANNNAAVGAALAIGALAIGAAIIASQNRERARPTYGYDAYGRPVPLSPCRDPYGRPIHDPACGGHRIYQDPGYSGGGYQSYRQPPPSYYAPQDDYRYAYRPGRVPPMNPYDPDDWRNRRPQH